MKILKGIGILVAFLALGEVIAYFIGYFLPGSVIGMLLLFAGLLLKIVKPEDIRTVADFLTGNMTILFVPAFAGIIDQWGLIKLHFWGWIAIIILTTVLVMLASGAAAELAAAGRAKKCASKPGAEAEAKAEAEAEAETEAEAATEQSENTDEK